MENSNKSFSIIELRIIEFFCLNSKSSVNQATLMAKFPITAEGLTALLDKLLDLKIIEEIKSEDGILYRNANPEYFPHGAEKEE